MGGTSGTSTVPSTSPKKSFASLLFKTASPPSATPVTFESASYKGEPGLKIPKSAIEITSKPLQFTLIGKFSHGRPTMERSRLLFSKLGLKGDFSLGHLDTKHLLNRLQEEEDFKRIWLWEIWYFEGYPMQIFKWTPDSN